MQKQLYKMSVLSMIVSFQTGSALFRTPSIRL